MTTITAKVSLIDNFVTIDVKWIITKKELYDSVDSLISTFRYSEPFPQYHSTEQFRLRAEFIANSETFVSAFNFCFWDCQFTNTVEAPPNISIVSTRCKINKKIKNIQPLNWLTLGNLPLIHHPVIKQPYFVLIDMQIKYLVRYDFIKSNIHSCLQSLWSDKDFLDVVIESSDGVSIKAHKTVLVARSKVFYAMFSHSMTEKNTAYLKLSDTNIGILKNLLKFIYTGSMPFVLETRDSKALLYLADKYELNDLKYLIQKRMYKLLNVENAIDLLIHSYIYKADMLQLFIMHFIREVGMSVIIKTNGWDILHFHYPEISTYMLEFLISERD